MHFGRNSIFTLLASFFDKGGLSHFLPYFLKVSIFLASRELFKTTKIFDLDDCTSGEIVFWHFSMPLLDNGGLFYFVPYFLKVSIFRASLEIFKTTNSFSFRRVCIGQNSIFTLLGSFLIIVVYLISHLIS